VVLALLLVLPFGGVLRQELELPYLLPPPGVICGLVAGAVVLSVQAGGLTAAWSARRISRSETAMILREGA